MTSTRTIDFPAAWGTGDPVPGEAFHFSKGRLHIFGCLLDDGANLFALVYPGGHRFARTAFAIDWGIEESYGPAPRSRDLATINAIWREHIDLMVDAVKDADREMVAAGLPTGREMARRLRREGWS